MLNRVSNTLSCFILLVLVFTPSPFSASAQVLYGSLTGNVTDPSGAAVPSAKVDSDERCDRHFAPGHYRRSRRVCDFRHAGRNLQS